MAHNLPSICSFSLELSSPFQCFLCPNINICLPLEEGSEEEWATIYQHPEFNVWKSMMILVRFPSALGLLRQLSLHVSSNSQLTCGWGSFVLPGFIFLVFWFLFTILNLQNTLPPLSPPFPQPARIVEYYTVCTPISQSFTACDWHKSSDRINNRSRRYQRTAVFAQSS